ncbi:hypothetical protein [Agrococcus casei]|uniref:hypothetical protein n=1 Tax=Agrococcus casei TaxID=343512 RepID=UPI003F8DDA35
MTDTNNHNEAEHRADDQDAVHDTTHPTEEDAHGSSNPGVTTIDDEVEELAHDQHNPAEHRAGEGEHGSANPGPR